MLREVERLGLVGRAARPDHPEGDLSAIRDQNFAEHQAGDTSLVRSGGESFDPITDERFREKYGLEPEQFVTQVLVARLGVRLIVVGSDFQFGRDRAGDSEFLRQAGEAHGFDVDVVDLVESGRVISSTRVPCVARRTSSSARSS